MAGLILVLNGGSSTLKAALIRRGAAEPVADETRGWEGDRAITVDTILDAWSRHAADIEAVAHRVVHGGSQFTGPALVNDTVLAGIEAVSELAPLHNHVALQVMRIARERLPAVTHVACFDTAFHSTLEESAWRYAIPYEWAATWGIRRFGFHGLSVEWSVRAAAEFLQLPRDRVSLIVAHLGSGCSVTAVRDGRSAWTSMGFTPLEGLMMGTRSGSIDPGLIFFLADSGRLSLNAVSEALERESGLLGISGVSSDMREVRAAAKRGDRRAALAIELFVARAAQEIAAAMTWANPAAIVFTGGVGEHDASTRDAIMARLPFVLCPVLPIKANEAVVMAEAAARLMDEAAASA